MTYEQESGRGVLLYDRLTRLLEIRDFKSCDAMFSGIDPESSDLGECFAILMGTSKIPMSELPSRAAFYSKVKSRYSMEVGAAEAAIALDSLQ